MSTSNDPSIFSTVWSIRIQIFMSCKIYSLNTYRAIEKRTLFSKFLWFWYPFHCSRMHCLTVKKKPFACFVEWAWCPPFSGSCPPERDNFTCLKKKNLLTTYTVMTVVVRNISIKSTCKICIWFDPQEANKCTYDSVFCNMLGFTSFSVKEHLSSINIQQKYVQNRLIHFFFVIHDVQCIHMMEMCYVKLAFNLLDFPHFYTPKSVPIIWFKETVDMNFRLIFVIENVLFSVTCFLLLNEYMDLWIVSFFLLNRKGKI